MEIRLLTEDDAPAYQTLRLRALREHPESFGPSFEEEQTHSIEQVARYLCEGLPHSFTLGALLDGQLVGIVTLSRFARRKTRHKAMVGGMYVAPEVRGQSIGRALLAAVIARAQAMDGLEDVTLAVTVGNAAARTLYVGAGFVSYGVEPRYIKVDQQYFDIEWMILHLAPSAV